MRTVDRRRSVMLSRRAVLGGAVVAALAGCDLFNGDPAPKPSAHPLEPALAGTLALLARYDAALTAHPALSARLTPLRDAHHAHAEAMAAAMRRRLPSPSVSSGAAAGAGDERAMRAGLLTAERAAFLDAHQAGLAAPSAYAALLGSIAACRATHTEALA